MRLKFAKEYDDKRVRGYEVEIDKIRLSLTTPGGFLVRVVKEWITPQWFSIAWFIKGTNNKYLIEHQTTRGGPATRP